MTKKITDTTKISSEEKLITALPGGILAQEARGQAELVTSEQLPIKGLLSDHAAWEAMGLKIFDGEPSDDTLFCRVELPAGWKKVPTDHHMWSRLVDETGEVRGEIFYKAAFYDRSAEICRILRAGEET